MIANTIDPRKLRISQLTVSSADPPRAVEDDREKAGADGHLHGARALDELEHLVDEDRHHEDVGEIPHADRRAAKQGGQRMNHRARRISSAARTTCTIWRNGVDAHDVRAAKHRSRHGGGGGPVAVRRVGAAGGRAQKRLPRRPDQHRPVERARQSPAAAPAHHNYGPRRLANPTPGSTKNRRPRDAGANRGVEALPQLAPSRRR